MREPHTPLPWKWADEWNDPETFGDDDSENGVGVKYASLALTGCNGKDVIPIKIDHYSLMIDARQDADAVHPEDRKFIEYACNNITRVEQERDALYAVLKDLMKMRDNCFIPNEGDWWDKAAEKALAMTALSKGDVV